MNLNYLTEKILPQREKEIKQGKHLSTMPPLYVVYNLRDNYCSGHSDYSPLTNLIGKDIEWGYFDRAKDSEDIEFKKSDKRMKDPEEVTRFWVDSFAAAFLTKEAAQDYMKYQKHNLSKHAYIFVHGFGYSNYQAEMLFSSPKPTTK